MSVLSQLLDGLKKLLTWWIVILPWEQAVRVRFGRRVKLLGPGLHFFFPFADRVFKQSTRLRTADLRPQTVTTSDGAVVTVAGNIKFIIADIRKLYDTLHNPSETIVDFVASEIAGAIRYVPKDKCSPGQIERDVNENIDFEQYGLGGVQVYVTDFAVAKVYRLLMDKIADYGRWGTDYGLDTQRAEGKGEY